MVKEGTSQTLFRDEFSDGNMVTNIEVAREIYYLRSGGILFEARLFGISKEAFLYNRVFNEQAEGGGGLNAVNPTALIGNMYNVADENDIILGFVNAAAVATKRVYVDRRDIDGNPLPDPFTSEEPEGWGG